MSDSESADRLERALRDLKARKQAAAAAAIKNAPESERMKALQAELKALPQSERREVLDAMGIKNVSAAPEPITPTGGRWVAPRFKPQPARWAVWRLLPRVELWEAVALSLEIEPTDAAGEELGRGRAASAHATSAISRLLPEEFFDRMDMCRRALSTKGPITPQGALYQGMFANPHCLVLLAEVAVFLSAAGYHVPEAMHPAPEIDKPGAETKTQREDRRLAACENAGLVMPVSHVGRLPDGVGKIAKDEGVKRQTFSDDLRAALKRRQSARAAGER